MFPSDALTMVATANGKHVNAPTLHVNQRPVQQSGCSRALAKIPYTRNTNFGERSRALTLLNTPLKSECKRFALEKMWTKIKAIVLRKRAYVSWLQILLPWT
uniref:Uncharacterized protein n=1 Tax=Magallana gigas TaxID=29159 RepID=A0A8W8I1X0_MAGGI